MADSELHALYNSLSPVYTSSFLTISINGQDKYLFNEWSGVLDAKRARQGCLAVLDQLQEHPHAKVLNNNIKVTGHYPGAIDWVGTVWFPTMYALGVQWFAWVYSPAFYTQISTDEIIGLSSKVTIQTFYEVQAAHDWLVQVKE